MEPDETVIVVDAPVDTTQVIVENAIEEAIEEIQEEVETANEIEQLKQVVQSQGNYLNDISGKLDRVLEHTAMIGVRVEDTIQAVEEVQTEVDNESLETEIALQETINQIDNDNEVQDGVVEEVLDTNDVIDAIAPEVKKERRRTRYI